MIDENAYGILIALHDPTNLEYSTEREAYVGILGSLERVLVEYLETTELAENMSVTHFGHAVYLEFADGSELTSPLTWLRGLRALCTEAELVTVGVLSYGSRWQGEDNEDGEEPSSPLACLGPGVNYVARSSEPLRKALGVDSCTQPGLLSEEDRGWGSGLYVEQEAIEALKRTLKNTPTPLLVAGGTFYRFGN
jgi:hypothetical protein